MFSPGIIGYAASGGDPNFANVVSLLHFDDVDGSTTITDVKGKTWTVSGNAQIDTAQSKFGGSSILFDGTGDFLTSQTSADFSFGSGNFTLEGWMRASSSQVQTTPTVIQNNGTWPTNTWALNANHASSLSHLSLWVSNWNSSSAVLAGTSDLRDNAWHHWAITRSGSTFRLFVDGTQQASGTFAGSIDTGTPAIIISGSGGNSYTGHQDEIRLTKGVARYTSNFTAPTAAFPDS